MPTISQFGVDNFVNLYGTFTTGGAGTGTSVTDPVYLVPDYSTLYEINTSAVAGLSTSGATFSAAPNTITDSSNRPIDVIYLTDFTVTTDTYISGLETSSILATPSDAIITFIFTVNDGVSLFIGSTNAGYTTEIANATDLLLVNNANDIKVANNSGSSIQTIISFQMNSGSPVQRGGEQNQYVLS